MPNPRSVPDPNKTIQSVYVRVKNTIGTDLVGPRKWTRMVSTVKPRPYQRTGKDTGVI